RERLDGGTATLQEPARRLAYPRGLRPCLERREALLEAADAIRGAAGGHDPALDVARAPFQGRHPIREGRAGRGGAVLRGAHLGGGRWERLAHIDLAASVRLDGQGRPVLAAFADRAHEV